jgi:hypothetical protein
MLASGTSAVKDRKQLLEIICGRAKGRVVTSRPI